MGQFASIDGEVEVLAVPGFHLTLTPSRMEVHTKDLDMVARFKVGVIRDAGYSKPVYLLVAGTSIGDFFIGDVPLAGNKVEAGISEVDLKMDMTDMEPIKVPFSVGGFEDNPEPGLPPL